MYMCSNTGLSGWAELRNRTRLCFHTTLKLLIKTAVPVANFPTRFFLRSHPRLPLDSSISQNTSDGTILV
ncbi:uncharacterized protein N7487_006971 [Penicillium crustosum]|uniref:Uncharacterized protein n=1 Tax=Penicillium cf. viridicatum TaxID=2972119 RepID=A0A9W9J564_9EURO|nr:uncharacterized protein N7487_006971 [Penicillium crustosum]KAJ5187861.1 hypothetical protein N7449_010855 [Penicillium cf. viridicatum]KAJ5412612.1 hypothetical protein N7487_006971 [Penicillium crustosum]